MTITKFDRKNLPLLRQAIEDALASVGKTHGLNLRAGHCTFADARASFKLECTIDNPEVQAEQERKDFNDYCSLFGLNPHHYGTVINHAGERLKLIGFIPRRSKFPLKFKQENGKIILLTKLALDRVRQTYDATSHFNNLAETKKSKVERIRPVRKD